MNSLVSKIFIKCTDNIFATFSQSSINGNHHLISSTYFEKEVLPMFTTSIEEKVRYFNLRKVILIHVSDEPQVPSMLCFGGEDYHTIIIFSITYKDFFNKEFLHGKMLNRNAFSSFNYTLYCFSNKNWIEIVHAFKLCDVTVSGGNNTKRHILSSVQIRLSQFLMIFRGVEFGSIIESFHHNHYKITNAMVNLEDKKFISYFENLQKKNNTNIDNSSINSNQISQSPQEESNVFNLISNELSLEKKEKNNSKSPYSKFNLNSNIKAKRMYHTSSLSLNNIELNKESLKNKSIGLFDPIENMINDNNFTLSYLDKIEKIINNSSYSPKELQFILEKSWIQIVTSKLEDPNFLSSRYSNKLISVIKTAFDTLNILNNNGQLKRRFPQFYNELNKIEFLMLTYSLLISYHNRVKYTALSFIIGRFILLEIYKSHNLKLFNYKNSLNLISDNPTIVDNYINNISNNNNNDNNFISFNEFLKKYKLENSNLIVKLGDFFISLLSTFPSNLFEKEFEHDGSPFSNHQYAIISLNPEYLEEVKNNIVIRPSSLPMICPPEKWSDVSYGGLLENSTIQDSIITGSSYHKHLVEDRENLYNAVNYMSNIPFSINTSLLNYINNEGSYLLESESINKSTKLQNELTLKIAKTFSNIPFYLNVNADWRGRIYTQSFFISYQGSDLSNALLQFNEGEVLNEEGLNYLYVYGANNHNENSISKSSYSDRINWINNNLNKIINLDKDLIQRAENKFVFTAFCLAIKSYKNNPNTIIKLPVFLDATCSGIQHLSALLRDIELGSKVNLFPQNENDLVKDIYSDMLDPINAAINKVSFSNPEYINLSNVKLTRKILKTSIMTKVYNVTIIGISEQIKSKLKKVTKNNKTFYQHNGINGIILLDNKDIYKISQIINEQVFVLFPSLRNIYKYFLEISKLCITLNIPLTWITPSGLKITQHYLKSKMKKVAITFGGRNKTIAIREWSELLDTAKQNQAIIPNIIHSLDASHLMNLINNANKDNFSPVITVHDCFGTHPNKMGELEYRVKKEFILLYTQKDFLQTFHNRIIQSIKDNNFSILNKNDKHYVENNDYIYEIPTLPLLGELDLQNIINSKYMIT